MLVILSDDQICRILAPLREVASTRHPGAWGAKYDLPTEFSTRSTMRTRASSVLPAEEESASQRFLPPMLRWVAAIPRH